MVLEAVIDDSYDHKVGVFALGGYIAPDHAWTAFAKEWEEYLPRFGILDKDGRYHFKMQEMAQTSERMARLPTFYRAIERHVTCAISCAFKYEDFENAKMRFERSINAQVKWGNLSKPYFFAFRLLLDTFHTHKKVLDPYLGLEEPVNFIFDDQSEKALILASWDNYMRARNTDIAGQYGKEPRFLDDKEFLPLQAADLWVYWVRRWVGNNQISKMKNSDFGVCTSSREYPKLHMFVDEDSIVSTFDSMARMALTLRSSPAHGVR